MNSKNPDGALPYFLRTLWVSEHARQNWETKLTEFVESWRQIEWISVAFGVRPCALIFVSQRELASLSDILAEFRIRTLVLDSRVREEGGKKILLYRAAIGRSKHLRAFRRAWTAADDNAIGELLGYPECCRSSFRETYIKEGLR